MPVQYGRWVCELVTERCGCAKSSGQRAIHEEREGSWIYRDVWFVDHILRGKKNKVQVMRTVGRREKCVKGWSVVVCWSGFGSLCVASWRRKEKKEEKQETKKGARGGREKIQRNATNRSGGVMSSARQGKLGESEGGECDELRRRARRYAWASMAGAPCCKTQTRAWPTSGWRSVLGTS